MSRYPDKRILPRIWFSGKCDRCGQRTNHIARPKGGAIGGFGPKWCALCLAETKR